jgi:hypothetical protein
MQIAYRAAMACYRCMPHRCNERGKVTAPQHSNIEPPYGVEFAFLNQQKAHECEAHAKHPPEVQGCKGSDATEGLRDGGGTMTE